MRREQSCALEGAKRTLRIDAEPPPSLGFYATRSPVVVFDPQQMTLSTGPSSARRTLLDRVALFLRPESASHRARYDRALRERQAVLGDSVRAGHLRGAELDAFESLAAYHGAAITAARGEAAKNLGALAEAAFRGFATRALELQVEYTRAGSEDQARAKQELQSRRATDARRKRASFGPHLDDLTLRLDGHAARVVASQGQHRAITLALKIAELACVAQARDVTPILLLDDVSSELDKERTEALFDHLATTACQIFLTTPRRDLVHAPALFSSGHKEFEVVAGKLTEISATAQNR